LSDEIDPVMKRTPSPDFIIVMHTITIIASYNSSVPVIGHLELAIGMLTSQPSWHGLQKFRGFSPWSQIFLRCIWAALDMIVNEFKQIGLIGFLIINATIMMME